MLCCVVLWIGVILVAVAPTKVCCIVLCSFLSHGCVLICVSMFSTIFVCLAYRSYASMVCYIFCVFVSVGRYLRWRGRGIADVLLQLCVVFGLLKIFWFVPFYFFEHKYWFCVTSNCQKIKFIMWQRLQLFLFSFGCVLKGWWWSKATKGYSYRHMYTYI